MNKIKNAAAHLSRIAPVGPLRWLKIVVYAFVFMLPFGMAMIALLVYFERRNRAPAAPGRLLALPAPTPSPVQAAKSASAPCAAATSTTRSTSKSKLGGAGCSPLPRLCSERP
jgi:hypothetical protein